MLTDRFPPDYGGGVRHALHLCHKLHEQGVRTNVLTGYKGRVTVSDQVEGVPVTRLPLPQREGVGVLPFYARLLRLLVTRRRDYDIIHAHAIHHHAYAGFLAGRLLGKPAIAKMAVLGGDDPVSITQRRLGRLQRAMLNWADALVAISFDLEEATLNAGWPADRLVCIPNGVDTAHFHPVAPDARGRLRRHLGLPQEAFVGVYVGFIARRKGIHQLARSWHRVTEAHPQSRLVLVGPRSSDEHWGVDDDYVAEVKEILRAGGFESAVVFAGLVPDAAPYLQAADIFAFPSRREGMPNALLEAMACGLPFVATRLGCIEEMAPAEQQPYLVPVDDAEALAEAIIALAHDAGARRQLGAAARRTVEEHFSLDAVADRYVELYHSLVTSR